MKNTIHSLFQEPREWEETNVILLSIGYVWDRRTQCWTK